MPAPTPHALPAARCRAWAQPAGDGSLALAIELALDRGPAVALPAFSPFIAFTLQAQADGRPVAVQQPALDLPLHPVQLRVAPGAPLTLHPPIRLRFAGHEAADAESAAGDGLVWTIAHPREGVTLTLHLDLPAPFDLSCPLALA